MRSPRDPGITTPLRRFAPLSDGQAGSPEGSLGWRVHNGGWYLTRPLRVLIAEGWVCIPAGFRTDLASIPRLLTIIPGLGRQELSVEAATFHDWGYRTAGQVEENITLSRRRVDRIFHTLMRTHEVGRIRARIAWAAVRAFGWLAWRRLSSREWALHLAE